MMVIHPLSKINPEGLCKKNFSEVNLNELLRDLNEEALMRRRPVRDWELVRSQLEILFEGRL